MMSKYYYTYEIQVDNPESGLHGCYYYGKHQTDNLDDGYYGSGVLIRRYIKKYGTDTCKKRILEFYPNRVKLDEAEYELVKYMKEVLGNKCMNKHDGGTGGHWVEYLSEEEYQYRCDLIKQGMRAKFDDEWFHMNAKRAGDSKKDVSKETRERWSESSREMHRNMSKEDKERRYNKSSNSLKEFYSNPDNEDKINLMKYNNKIKNQEVAKIWRTEFKELFGHTPEYFRNFELMQDSLDLYKEIKDLPAETKIPKIKEFLCSIKSKKSWRTEFKEMFGCTPESFRKYNKMKDACDLYKSLKGLSKMEVEHEINRFMESINV